MQLTGPRVLSLKSVVNLPPWSLNSSLRYCGVKEGMGMGSWEVGAVAMVWEGDGGHFGGKGVGSPGEPEG